MSHTTSEINRHFRIKVNGVNHTGQVISKLVGVSGLTELIGSGLTEKFVSKAFESMEDKSEHKLRRGLTIRFYAK